MCYFGCCCSSEWAISCEPSHRLMCQIPQEMWYLGHCSSIKWVASYNCLSCVTFLQPLSCATSSPSFVKGDVAMLLIQPRLYNNPTCLDLLFPGGGGSLCFSNHFYIVRDWVRQHSDT